MATHSGTLAWRIPGTAEPGGLPSMGPHRVGHDWSDLAAAAATSTWNTSSMYFKIKALASYTHMHTQWAKREFLLYLEKKCCSQQTAVLLFSPLVVSDFLQPDGLQLARIPCPSLSLWLCSNSCPLSRWCHPTISSSWCPLLLLPSIFPRIRVSSSESVLCIRWPKYWSFSCSISPSSEYSGLISFRMDWLDLFAVQGTLKNLLQHHSSKASILQCSAFFMVQLSHPYITPGKKHSFD